MPAPADLIAVGRLANPATVIDTVAAWAKYPIDVRALVSKNKPEAAALLVYDAPVEFAVALDNKGLGNFPQPFAVVSIGVSSVEGTVEFAKRQGQSVRMQRPGVYQIAKGKSPVCAVAASIGKAPARLVCGDRQEDIDALLGYATRGLPTENMGKADLHIELRADPLRRRYSKDLRQLKTMAAPFVLSEMSLDSPRFDRALADAVHGVADEVLSLAEDIDQIRIEAALDKSGNVLETTTAFKFRGQSSWTVQTMVDAAKRSKGVPEMFWKLPKDSELATFGVGANAKRYDAIRKTLAELMDGALEKEKVPRKVRDQLSDVLLDTWTAEGDFVYAHSELMGSGAPGKPGSALAIRDSIRSRLGWYVIGIDDKPAKYKGYLDKVVKLYNDAQLRQLLDKRMKVKGTDLPKLSARPARGLAGGATTYELVLTSAFFGKLDGAEKGARVPPLSIVITVLPDGDRTWIGLSADEKLLNTKLTEVKKGDATLASREGIGQLKTARGVSGGFFTAGNLVKSAADSIADASDIKKALNAMPHHGETPVLMWTTVSAGAGPNVLWTLRVPRAVVEDIAAIAPLLAAMKKEPVPVMAPEGIAPPVAPGPVKPKALSKPKKR